MRTTKYSHLENYLKNKPKKRKWVVNILIELIKAYKRNEKVSIANISARLAERGIYDDLGFNGREAIINNILKWLSTRYKKLSEIKSSESFFDNLDKEDEVSKLLSTLFNEETANLRIYKFGNLWGLE